VRRLKRRREQRLLIRVLRARCYGRRRETEEEGAESDTRLKAETAESSICAGWKDANGCGGGMAPGNLAPSGSVLGETRSSRRRLWKC
jgi:hypothetical protein